MIDGTENFNEEKAQAKLKASLYGKDSRIYFSKDVLRALKKPRYVCLKIKKDMTSFLVMPCSSKETMSFRVPEKLFSDTDVKMRISSQGFIYELLVKNGLDTGKTYHVDGVYLPKSNAVVFPMSQAEIFPGLESNIE